MNNPSHNADTASQGKTLSGLRAAVLCCALAVMIVITAWPHVFGNSTSNMNHNAAMISMLGMSFGFVYGVGFVPNNRWLAMAFSAPVALGLMALGFFLAH